MGSQWLERRRNASTTPTIHVRVRGTRNSRTSTDANRIEEWGVGEIQGQGKEMRFII